MVDNPKLTPSTKQTLILELESDFSWTRPVSTVGKKGEEWPRGRYDARLGAKAVKQQNAVVLLRFHRGFCAHATTTCSTEAYNWKGFLAESLDCGLRLYEPRFIVLLKP